MNFDLSRMQQLMQALGNPQNKFPAIHIAGTNGKGSTAAFLSSILKQSGLRVGLYTSTHLVSVHERFQINEKLISTLEISRIVKKIKRTSSSFLRDLTQFEMLTAIAFLWFAQRKIDVGVIEVGLGGRLDATNVMQNVLASVITNIDLEHTQILGKTIPKIAREKAGIIKSGVPVITGAQESALKEIRKISRQRRSTCFTLGMSAPSHLKSLPEIPLIGSHQRRNAALAMKTIDVITPQLKKMFGVHLKVSEGIRESRWPGRFEILRGRRQVVILDGAHNPAAIRVLTQTLKDQNVRRVTLIFGVLQDKNYDAMIRSLKPYVRKAILVPLQTTRSLSRKQLGSVARKFRNGELAPSIKSAWKRATRLADATPILVTGSLYLVGEFKKEKLWPN